MLAASYRIEIWTTDHEAEHGLVSGNENLTIRVFPRWPGWQFFSGRLLLELAAKAERFNAIHVFGLWTFAAFAAWVTGFRKKTPVFLHAQGFFLPVALKHHGYRKKAAVMLGVRYLVNKFTGIICCSEVEVEPIRKWGAHIPVCVVPNPVEPLEVEVGVWRSRTDFPGGCPIVTFLNRFNPIKRVLELCRAFLIVQEKHPTVRFVVAGDWQNPYGQAVRDYARSVGLRAEFPGHLSENRKYELLRDTDVLCQYSAQEAHSNTLIEGLAMGVPLVISSGCNFENIQTSGAGVVVDSEEALAAAVIEYLENEAKRTEAGRRARDFASSRYTYDIVRDRLLGAMNDMG